MPRHPLHRCFDGSCACCRLAVSQSAPEHQPWPGLMKHILPCACSGGVAPVGHRHDVEIRPLAARDNRLGTSGANKAAGKSVGQQQGQTLCHWSALLLLMLLLSAAEDMQRQYALPTRACSGCSAGIEPNVCMRRPRTSRCVRTCNRLLGSAPSCTNVPSHTVRRR